MHTHTHIIIQKSPRSSLFEHQKTPQWTSMVRYGMIGWNPLVKYHGRTSPPVPCCSSFLSDTVSVHVLILKKSQVYWLSWVFRNFILDAKDFPLRASSSLFFFPVTSHWCHWCLHPRCDHVLIPYWSIPYVNGKFRVPKWRYVSTIFLAIFSGIFPYIGLI